MNKIISNIRFAIASKFINVLIGAILTILLARWLGPDEYGLFFLAISILGMIKIFTSPGISKSAGRYIAKYKEQDQTQTKYILEFSFFIIVLLGVPVAILSHVLRDHLSNLFGEPNLSILFTLGFLYIVFSPLMTYSTYILQSYEEIKYSMGIKLINNSSRLVLSILALLVGYSAGGVLVAYGIAFAISSIAGLSIIYKNHYNKITNGKKESKLYTNLVKYSFPLIITRSASSIDNYIDTILVGLFVGPAGVAYYTISDRVLKFIDTPANGLGFSLSPTLEAERAGGNKKRASELFEQSITYLLLLYIPCVFGIILVSEDLLLILFGSEYMDAALVLQALSFYALFRAVTELASRTLDFFGRAKARAYIKIVTSVLNLLLNLVLIPAIGVVGAAISTSISFGLYAVACLMIIYHELDLGSVVLYHNIIRIVFITLAMVVTVHSIVGYIEGILSFIIVVLIGIIVWLIGSVLGGFITKENVKYALE